MVGLPCCFRAFRTENSIKELNVFRLVRFASRVPDAVCI